MSAKFTSFVFAFPRLRHKIECLRNAANATCQLLDWLNVWHMWLTVTAILSLCMAKKRCQDQLMQSTATYPPNKTKPSWSTDWPTKSYISVIGSTETSFAQKAAKVGCDHVILLIRRDAFHFSTQHVMCLSPSKFPHRLAESKKKVSQRIYLFWKIQVFLPNCFFCNNFGLVQPQKK